MKLTDKAIAKIIATTKPMRYTDDACRGLSLHVSAAQEGKQPVKAWHLKFTDPDTKKQTTFTLGRFPDVNTADARKKAEKIRVRLRDSRFSRSLD